MSIENWHLKIVPLLAGRPRQRLRRLDRPRERDRGQLGALLRGEQPRRLRLLAAKLRSGLPAQLPGRRRQAAGNPSTMNDAATEPSRQEP